MAVKNAFINREISWLSFNERVLQEAEDTTTPLIERLRFLGIFSNNRDEFFRVRVATVRRMAMTQMNKADNKHFVGGKPSDVLKEISEIVLRQEKRFENIYQRILKDLAREKIFIINENQLNAEQAEFIKDYFHDKIQPTLIPIMVNQVPEFPYLKDQSIYLAVKLSDSKKKVKTQYSLIEVPVGNFSRFLVLPNIRKSHYIILLDDVIRYCLQDVYWIFPYDKIEAYTFKITRDAELDIDNDVSKSFLEKMKKSLKARRRGEPVRLVYDSAMPKDLLQLLTRRMHLDNDDDHLIPGGRYHNFKDFMKFPNVGSKDLEHVYVPPLPHPDLRDVHSVMDVIRKKDVLLHYPYQSFGSFIDLLREAAIDPKVKSIKITLYRVASKSQVINALINAVRNGKKVMVVVELQARFDEEANIYWSDILQDAGVKVIFGVPGLKVHSKLCLIHRKEEGKSVYYASLGTGNYHENTAKIYSDVALLTSDPKITKEANKVFGIFEQTYRPSYYYRHLLLSPMHLRNKFVRLINHEIKLAKEGKEGYILLKMNSLVDVDLIKKLYQASRAGVKIQLIVRGICSLVPGVKGMSENIEAYSILDKYLEHARIYVFGNGGNRLYYLSSADWMVRNLDHRIEVTCPVYDEGIKTELQDMLDIQLQDNVKARILDAEQSNQYRKSSGEKPVRTQFALHDYYKAMLSRK